MGGTTLSAGVDAVLRDGDTRIGTLNANEDPRVLTHEQPFDTSTLGRCSVRSDWRLGGVFLAFIVRAQ